MSSAAQAAPSGPEEGRSLGDSSSLHGSSDTLSSSAVNRALMDFLVYVGRAVLLFYPVYLTGYLGLSVSWVLLCMVVLTWWRKNRQWKDARFGSAFEFVDNETTVINKELEGGLQMASWVHFPDVEKVDWVNKVVEQAWPFFGMFMEKLLKENIQSTIRMTNATLKTFTFTKVHFGHTPPRITGIKAYTDEVDHREVILDMKISYDGDVDIDADVQPAIAAGVKGLKMQGMLRVILEPLVGQVPLVGGLTFFFMRRPTMELNWTGMTNLLDCPGLSQFSEETINDIIASLMVLPNRMCFPLIDQVKMDNMRFPLPRGVVRVYLKEARDLVAKDTYMMGIVKGKSDPYVVLRGGHSHFKSKTIKENLNPRWNEVYEFVVHEAPGQELEVELFDEDTDKDDFLGNFQLDFGEVKREKEMDQWFTLEGVQSGEIHLNLQWLSLNTDPSLLEESTNGCACAMLAVYLDNASNLPKDHSEITHNQKHGKHPKEARLTKRSVGPSSYVELSVDHDVQKSKVAFTTKDPEWAEGFTFFVHNIKTQQLNVQVKEHEKKTLLGTVSVPLTRLLNISDMTLDQRLMLERSGANSQIKLKATLRVLTVEKPPPQIILTPPQPEMQSLRPNQGSASSAPVLPISPALSSSPVPPAQHSLPTESANGASEDYRTHRRNSFLASETPQKPSSGLSMRRYDSHSLLSDNSIASSRLDIAEGAQYPEAIRNHQGSFGEIQLTVRYATLRKKLIILVNSCRDLFPCSENGTDSYVRLYLLPDQNWKHRKRTHVKKRTVNPVFNDKFEFDVPLNEVRGRKLDVSVKNNKMFHRRERKEIGMVVLDLSQLDLTKGVTDWYELTLPGLHKSS